MRLFHAGMSRYFVVHAETVYADLDGNGRIANDERYSGEVEGALLAAARHFDAYYEAPFPGARSLDPQITSGGLLNAKERQQFIRDAGGILVRRPDLLAHLDFFDRVDGDGMISLRENYRSWRDLGYGALKSAILTLGSAAVFGRASDGFAIDIERIAEKRPKGSTRIYGPDGNVDPTRLAEFAAVFDGGRGEGVLTHEELRSAIADRADLGTVPRRQFESLFLLTARLNGASTVTRAQFLALFDNSLFWTAASLTDNSGKRRL